MKTIGIIGGVSWHSSAVYYRLINEAVAARLGGQHCAKLLLAQADFEDVERAQRENRWDIVATLLGDLARGLEKGGADFFLIACNTVHTVDRQIEAAASIPFLHIVDPTAEKIRAAGLRKVGLMGSQWTMCGTYFTERLADKYGLDVIIPEGDHQENVHSALYRELTRGIIREETRAQFRAAIADLAERGAQGVILGCTEFMLLVRPQDSPVPLFDTTTLHVAAAVDRAVSPAAASRNSN